MNDDHGRPCKKDAEMSAMGHRPPSRPADASRDGGANAQEGHPLDRIAKKHRCFVSDLRLDPSLRRDALRDLLNCEESAYTLQQWRDAVNYLTENARVFESIGETRRYIVLYLKSPRAD